MESLAILLQIPRAMTAPDLADPAVSPLPLLANHPSFGSQKAQAIYRASVFDTINTAIEWRRHTSAADPNRRVTLYLYKPTALAEKTTLETENIQLLAKQNGLKIEIANEPAPTAGTNITLGQRLQHCFLQEFKKGARAVCMIGPYTPHLPAHMIDFAFRTLYWEPTCLGPTCDSGVWLVGAQRTIPPIFPEVFQDMTGTADGHIASIIERLQRAQLRTHALPLWYHLNQPAQIERFLWHSQLLGQGDPQTGSLTRQALNHP